MADNPVNIKGMWRLLRASATLLGVGLFISTIIVWTGSPLAEPRVAKDSTNKSKASQESVRPSSTVPDQSLQQALDEVKAKIKDQGTILDAQKNEVSYLTDIAKWMISVAGLFTLVIGGASWAALENQRRSAERELATQQANFNQLKERLQQDFPMLGRIQDNFRTILLNLRSACQPLVAEDDTYSNLTWKQRQEILYYESVATTALLLNTKGYEKDLSEIYRNLGRFYGSRFNSHTKDDEFNSYEDKGDFERSRFYFDQSVAIDPGNYKTLMDAGYFAHFTDDAAVAGLSESYYKRAAQAGPDFQRPLVGIAMIELDAFGNPIAALDALKKAESKSHYDESRPSPKPQYISYLQACAYCLEAKSKQEGDQLASLEKAMNKLGESSQNPNEEWRDIWHAAKVDRGKYFSVLDGVPKLAPGSAAIFERLSSYVEGGHYGRTD